MESLENEVGKCISCGFCESVCPTLPAAGYDLWKGARGRVIMGKEVLNAVNSGKADSLKISDSFYSCLDCNACLYVCPAGVNAGLVSHLSREVITSGRLEGNENSLAGMIVAVTMRYMNPLGVREQCANWFEGMKADADSSDLLYTGNMFQLMAYTKKMSELRGRMGSSLSSFMSRIVANVPWLIKLVSNRKDSGFAESLDNSLRNIVKLLAASGTSFNYLGKDEPYPGTFIHDLGYKELFRVYANKVTEIFRKAGARRIITVDPHTYDLLKNTYPEFVDDFDMEVVHYLDLIGEVDFRQSEEKITFHEPCHFSLREEVYNVPLETLKRTSRVDLPPRSGRRTMCCGGPDELLFPEISHKVSNNRYEELDNMASDKIVTACPICYSNLNKGIKVIEIGDYLAGKLK